MTALRFLALMPATAMAAEAPSRQLAWGLSHGTNYYNDTDADGAASSSSPAAADATTTTTLAPTTAAPTTAAPTTAAPTQTTAAAAAASTQTTAAASGASSTGTTPAAGGNAAAAAAAAAAAGAAGTQAPMGTTGADQTFNEFALKAEYAYADALARRGRQLAAHTGFCTSYEKPAARTSSCQGFVDSSNKGIKDAALYMYASECTSTVSKCEVDATVATTASVADEYTIKQLVTAARSFDKLKGAFDEAKTYIGSDAGKADLAQTVATKVKATDAAGAFANLDPAKATTSAIEVTKEPTLTDLSGNAVGGGTASSAVPMQLAGSVLGAFAGAVFF